MIKSGIVQESLADITNPHLPPLTNLPQWSRINTLDKARYPKPFVKDQLQPVKREEIKSWQENAQLNLDLDMMADLSENQEDGGTATARIYHLERSLVFIQREHEQTLQSLHAEIDQLKRENKDLTFQVINVKDLQNTHLRLSDSDSSKRHTPTPPKPNSGQQKVEAFGQNQAQDKVQLARKESRNNLVSRTPKPPSGRRLQSASKQASKEDQAKLQELQDENSELRKNLNEEVNRNLVLSQLLDRAQNTNRTGKSDGQTSATSRPSESQSAPVVTQTALEESQMAKSRNVTSASMVHNQKENPPPSQKLPYAATLDPLRVSIAPHLPRPPTLGECETIIRHLIIKTDRQGQEMTQLKSDLREALYSHKWTPDAYLVAKAYVVDEEALEAAERERLPKIALSQQHRHIPESAYATREKTSLPPLKQTLGNKAIERRKRTQLLQQARRSKEVLH